VDNARHSDPHPDLSGLQPSYQVRPTGTVRKVLIAVIVLLSALQVLRVIHDPSWPNIVIAVGYVLVYGFGLAFWIWRPPAVLLSADGLAVRRFLRTPPPVPWNDALEVQVQTRWQDHSTAVLRNTTTLALVGVPAEDAQRLADALNAAR
jgi:hypothetical protein